MIDICEEARRVIQEKDYVLDSADFYEISSDTIHIKTDNFADPIVLFILLHEIAHRCQIVLLKLDSLDSDILEMEANRIAFDSLLKFGIPISKRVKRKLSQLLK